MSMPVAYSFSQQQSYPFQQSLYQQDQHQQWSHMMPPPTSMQPSMEPYIQPYMQPYVPNYGVPSDHVTPESDGYKNMMLLYQSNTAGGYPSSGEMRNHGPSAAQGGPLPQQQQYLPPSAAPRADLRDDGTLHHYQKSPPPPSSAPSGGSRDLRVDPMALYQRLMLNGQPHVAQAVALAAGLVPPSQTSAYGLNQQ